MLVEWVEGRVRFSFVLVLLFGIFFVEFGVFIVLVGGRGSLSVDMILWGVRYGVWYFFILLGVI